MACRPLFVHKFLFYLEIHFFIKLFIYCTYTNNKDLINLPIMHTRIQERGYIAEPRKTKKNDFL